MRDNANSDDGKLNFDKSLSDLSEEKNYHEEWPPERNKSTGYDV